MNGVNLGPSFSTSEPSYTKGTNPLNGLGLGPAPNATNSWLENCFLNHDPGQPIYSFPYAVEVLDDALQVCTIGDAMLQAIPDGCNPSRPVPTPADLKPGDKYQTQWPPKPSFQWGEADSFTFDSVEDYGPLYAAFSYSCNGGKCVIPVVRGMAMVTAQYPAGSAPLIKCAGTAVLSINGQGVPGAPPQTGTKFTIEYNNNTTWTFYTSQPVTVTANINGLAVSNVSAETVIRAALNALNLPDGAESTYPNSATVGVDGGNLYYSFELKSMSGGTASGGHHYFLPIHLDYMQNPPAPSSTAKPFTDYGEMTLLPLDSSAKVTFDIPLPDISYVEDITVQEDVKTALATDAANFKPVGGGPGVPAIPADPYGAGKTLARAARLAAIADQAGETTTRNTIITTLQGFLQQWLDGDVTYAESYTPTGERTNQMRYETQWGGICTSAGLANSGADFGEGWYNDHHFHWGYFMYAFALAIKYDQSGDFYSNNKEKILYFVRDVMNPSTEDPYFTVTRNKDWWTWQSYAAGLFLSGNSGRNQESCGEAINCYYGAALLGDAIDNDQLKMLGQLTLAMETLSRIRYYFYTGSVEQSWWAKPFKEQGVVGIHFENMRQSSLFWCINSPNATLGDNLTGFFNIQLMPFTPVTKNDVNKAWFDTVSSLITGIMTNDWDGLPSGWQGYMDMLAAWNAHVEDTGKVSIYRDQLKNIDAPGFDDGNSKTNGLFWIDALSSVLL